MLQACTSQHEQAGSMFCIVAASYATAVTPFHDQIKKPKMIFKSLHYTLLITVLCTLPASAEDFQGSDHPIDYDEEPVNYSKVQPHNKIEDLQVKINSGAVTIAWDEKFGYLPAVMEALGIPKSSQTLVFSKTSLQRKLISPANPRSLYFNDDIYAGYIPGAPVMEFSIADPKIGAAFYSVVQDKAAPPSFVRNSDCMQCHGAQRSLGVPGHFMRSVPTDTTGELDVTGEANDMTHCAPLADRWAGWYVTGKHGAQQHRGNLVGLKAYERAKSEPGLNGNLTELDKYFDQDSYPAKGSDIVALMVLAHQTHMHNYIARMNLETRQMMAMYGHTRYLRHQTEAFLRYILFTEEATLTEPVEGNPHFITDFTAQSVRDSKGRSLRDLDLKTRLFKYPCSFLIYSESFDAIPAVMRDQILQALHDILTGKNTDPQFAHIPAEDRLAILEILRETKPNLPDYWR